MNDTTGHDTQVLPVAEERPARAEAWARSGPRHMARRTFRPRRSIPGVIVAALLAAAGILGTVQAVSAAVDSPLWTVSYSTFPGSLRTTSWDATATLAAAAAVAFVGLLLILIGIVPGRPRAIPLASGDVSVVAGAPRRSLARSLGRLAQEADGIDRARASIGRDAVKVRATSGSRDITGLSEGVRDQVQTRLAALGPLWPLRVRVRLRRRKR